MYEQRLVLLDDIIFLVVYVRYIFVLGCMGGVRLFLLSVWITFKKR